MSGSSGKPDPRRFLPGVDRLAGSVRQSAPSLPEWAVNDAARATVDAARRSLEEDPDQGEPDLQALVARAAERAEELARPRPRRVVNATGVVLHTNLGRAVLAPARSGRRRRPAPPTATSSSISAPGAGATGWRRSAGSSPGWAAARPDWRSTTTPPPCCSSSTPWPAAAR